MPQFTQWNVPSPFPNVLYNPAAVDAAIAKTQSELGNLDINRQELALKQNKFAQGMSLGDEFAKSIDGTTGAADSTPFERKMGFSEGGGTADKVNSEGYAGQYQFGAARLADLGLYTPAQGEDLKRNEWKGTFKIAPYGVANLQDFLKNPAAQHAAFVAHVADVDRVIDATPGADKFDRNGLRAVAHLGGNGGMQAFVASGGTLNRADSNGTSLKAYYQKFAEGGAPALQKAFGAAHGPGGPQSNLPTVQPGRLAGWVDPNAPLPVPPIPPAGGPPPVFNPNAGPRLAGASPAGAPGVEPAVAPGALPPAAAVGTDDPNVQVSYPPTTVGQADETVPVEPSRQAMRLGGVAAAGDAAGPGLPDPAPNRMAYGTGLPGVTIGLPANGLAPAPVVTAAAPPPVAQPPAPTPVQPPPAPSRVIQREPLIQSGMARGLTRDQALNAARLFKSGADPASVLQHIDQLRHQNDQLRQQDAQQAAIDEKENYARRHAAEKEAQERADKEEAKRIAAEKVAREVANDAKLQQSKGEDGDSLRVLQAIAPKIRNGQELTEEEADMYDLHRRRWAQGPQQQVPDGKGGTMIANVGREISDRFPPLPGQKEYAGLRPIPGTEKQPDPAPPNAVTAMHDISAGNRTIVKALDELEKYPAGVGLVPGAMPPAMSNWVDPAGVKVKAKIGQVQGHIYHEMAGTAQSAAETGRLRSFVPSEKDDAETAKTKLRAMLENNRETLLDHYRSFGPEAGFRRQRNIEDAILDTIPEEAVARLKKEPDTAKAFDRKFGRGAAKLALQND